MKKWKYIIISIAVLITSLLILKVKNEAADVMEYMPVANKIIVLDAGHGGIDPGAMNNDKTILEKDVNLAITKKLRDLLEASGATVIMTRDKDVSLYEEDGNKTIRQKYNENLRNRKNIIDQSDADVFVSIHLNAFEQSKYYGAQTFYPKGKDDGKELAQFIQDELKRVVDQDNDRKIKPRDDIYLLKNTTMPSVLIECGFLSNEKESKLLADSKYQDKVAWAIYVGIQKYLGQIAENN
ncbi:N-acetylmuramoyl-L-alanine amidase CwlD [Intestinibacter bartlettii]|uniref:N-acetylmuramoyl-L-alanine amidase CwlD n=1 Tax=Intestinibacter bartlettii TaxID=261299 RepID=A0ABS6DTX5_9FIRM|nr:N-acetylmuramoyl-L-alanine amidase CwlD [Intestinibacter bartlettii]MBU5335276.1 N-acetylmuramoyl-L-alanine amidase CwlD [Intestinibacter bartlettii]